MDLAEPRRFQTRHWIERGDARKLSLADASVDLVVTSPPYPMIEMWDEVFSGLNPKIGRLLAEGSADKAFEAMHAELDRAWAECLRVLRPGGLACINVGDAVRTMDGDFRLHSNHSRILYTLRRLGFSLLPDILWRKPTNAPNKFLGSGMLPAGAYVTYEHEYILIARKGGKRLFESAEAKLQRRRSAFFWEERNSWFSDVWLDLRGVRQDAIDPEARKRSAAFPFELAWRLIQMHSLEEDVVLDPFGGVGTTSLAAAASGRSSVLIEFDPVLVEQADASLSLAPELGKARAKLRIEAHLESMRSRALAGKEVKHRNRTYGFPVITAQETDLALAVPLAIRKVGPGVHEVDTIAGAAPGSPGGEIAGVELAGLSLPEADRGDSSSTPDPRREDRTVPPRDRSSRA